MEVGSGSGGTSAVVMAALADLGEKIEFVYTDISPQLVAYGRKTYGPTYPFATFKLLDVEKDTEDQVRSYLLHLSKRNIICAHWECSFPHGNAWCVLMCLALACGSHRNPISLGTHWADCGAGIQAGSLRRPLCHERVACHAGHGKHSAALQGAAAQGRAADRQRAVHKD